MIDYEAGKMTRRQAQEVELIDLLGQRKWWRNRKGEVYKRKQMAIDYKMNTLAYLIREAPSIVARYVMGPAFYCAPDDVQFGLDEMMDKPAEWMLQQAFCQALLADIIKFAGVTPEALGLEWVGNIDVIGANVKRGIGSLWRGTL